MRGIFSQLPADSLAAAMAPVAERCERLDWAVALQSGPLRFPYYDEDHPDRLLSYHHVEGPAPMHWFGRGFLPHYADCLILDEWSYYLGFDSRAVGAAELAGRLAGDLSPGARLFDAVARFDLLYLLRVDAGWWEAYAADGDTLGRLRQGWPGREVSSRRWVDGTWRLGTLGPH